MFRADRPTKLMVVEVPVLVYPCEPKGGMEVFRPSMPTFVAVELCGDCAGGHWRGDADGPLADDAVGGEVFHDPTDLDLLLLLDGGLEIEEKGVGVDVGHDVKWLCG